MLDLPIIGCFVTVDTIMQANVEGWTPSTNDANAGIGNYGSCCPEMVSPSQDLHTHLTRPEC